MWQTDRQTDGQTDILPQYSPRHAYASRGKNYTADWVGRVHVINLLVIHCNYVSMLYRFWDIQRRITVCPWNRLMRYVLFKVNEMISFDRSHTTSYYLDTVSIVLSCTIFELYDLEKYRSLKSRLGVTLDGSGTTRQITLRLYEFPLAFHTSCGTILYISAISQILIENCYVLIPRLQSTPSTRGTPSGYHHYSSYGKNRSVKLSEVTRWWKRFKDTFSRFHTIHERNRQTAGQTDKATSTASRGKNEA